MGTAHKNNIFSSTLLNTHMGTDLGMLVFTSLIPKHTQETDFGMPVNLVSQMTTFYL